METACSEFRDVIDDAVANVYNSSSECRQALDNIEEDERNFAAVMFQTSEQVRVSLRLEVLRWHGHFLNFSLSENILFENFIQRQNLRPKSLFWGIQGQNSTVIVSIEHP